MAVPPRRRSPRDLARIAVLGVALWAPAARAQSAEAESLFEQGDLLEKAGKIGEACQAFEASNRIEARAGTLIRLGECRERNHQLASAWSAYKDALTRVKDPKKRDIATGKVAELGPKLSYLTVNVPPASQLAGLELTRDGHAIDPGEWNHAVPLDGATYAIEAHAPGRAGWSGSVTVAEERGQATIDVPALAVDAHATPAVTSAVPIPTHPQPPPPEPSAWTGKRKGAVVAAGVAVLAGVGGAVFGELAKGKQHDADALCPQQVCSSEADKATATAELSAGQSRALAANLAFGVAGVAAIAAGVLWLTGAPERPSVGVAASPGARSAFVTLGGRF